MQRAVGATVSAATSTASQEFNATAHIPMPRPFGASLTAYQRNPAATEVIHKVYTIFHKFYTVYTISSIRFIPYSISFIR